MKTTRATCLTASEMRLLDAYQKMHPEDRGLLIAFAETRSAAYVKERPLHLTLVREVRA